MSGKIDLIDEDESPRALRETGYDVLSEGIDFSPGPKARGILSCEVDFLFRQACFDHSHSWGARGGPKSYVSSAEIRGSEASSGSPPVQILKSKIATASYATLGLSA